MTIDLSAVTAAFAATGAATNLMSGSLEAAERLRKLIGAKNDPAAQMELVTIFRGLLDAIRAVARTETRLRDVEAQMRGLERFDQEAGRFALQEMPGGSVVWVLQNPGPAEPIQHLCTRCYENRILSRLQPVDWSHYGCPVCQTNYKFKLRPADGKLRVARSPGC